jgi:hypothetical protein
MTALFAVLLTAAATAAAGFAAAQETPAKPPVAVSLYKTASSAACAEDDVTVWVDPERRLYYVKGDPLYGRTKRGGYNCRRHVEAAGYRPGREATPR